MIKLSYFSTDSNPTIDYSTIHNPECGIWHRRDFSSVEFQTLTENTINFNIPNQPRHLEINIGKGALFKLIF